MPVIELDPVVWGLGGRGVLRTGRIEGVYWAGDAPYTTVVGSDVVTPSRLRVDIVDGVQQETLSGLPTDGNCCVRFQVTHNGVVLFGPVFVTLPDVPTIAFGDLPVVDPATFAPTDPTPTLIETIRASAAVELEEQKGAPEGVAGLGADGVVPESQIPERLGEVALDAKIADGIEGAALLPVSEVSANLTGDTDNSVVRRVEGRVKAMTGIDGDDVVNVSQMVAATDAASVGATMAEVAADPESAFAIQSKATFGPLVEESAPDGFAFDSAMPITYAVYRTALGLYVVDIDGVSAVKPSSGTTYYVGPLGGSSNTGLTADSPLDLPSAIAKPNVGTIVFLPGEYFRNRHAGASITKSLNIIGTPGAILTAFNDPTSLTWTLHSGNIYKTTRSATIGVIDKRDAHKTVAGDYPLYEKKADPASITSAGQWAIVGSEVYVWAFSNANLVTDSSFMRLNIDAGNGPLQVLGDYTLWIEGLQVEGGGTSSRGTIDAVNNGSARPQIIAFDTTVKYSANKGFRYAAAKLALFVRCTASSTAGDGFSGHAGLVSGATIPSNAIEVDCLGWYNGWHNDGDETQNGSTSHNGSRALRVNGDYRYSYGPVVDEDTDAASWNLGVRAGSSRGPTRPWAYCSSGTGSSMWLVDCSADPGAVAIRAYDTTAIRLRRPRTGSILGMSRYAGGTVETF